MLVTENFLKYLFCEIPMNIEIKTLVNVIELRIGL